MNGLIRWFANNSVAANLLMAVAVFGGLASMPSIQQKSFPDIEIEAIAIGVAYLGAAPEEVEEGVCVKIEEELQDITGIERITSSSNEGSCGVTAELVDGYSVDRALSEVKNAVDGISTFPAETEKPVINHFAIKRNALQLALSGPVSERALKIQGERIRDEIASLPGVTQVELTNVRDYEISIDVSEESLRRYGLSFDRVVAAVRASSLDLPGGSIKTTGGEILLRSKGQAYTGDQFERIVVLTHEDGTRLLLGDVATVVDGFEEAERFSRFDGNPAVLIKVYRVGDQKVLELVETVKKYLDEARQRLPEGLSLTVWRDDSQYLRDRLEILLRNGRGGFIMVFVVLALFLRLRLAFWVAIGVPISILGALWLFPAVPLAIDVLTLFAFILVLGLLVDDAIVVGENVHTHQERGEDPLQAAIVGTQEVSVPVIFGVLTTVAAFAPMIVAEGMMGQMFSAIGITVVFCLLFSVVESQLILPAHLGHHMDLSEKPAREGSIQYRWKKLQTFMANSLTRLASRGYKPALAYALEWRYASLAAGVVFLLVALGIVGTGRMHFTFFPKIENDFVSANVTMPLGTPIEATAVAVAQLEASARELKREIDGESQTRDGTPVVKHILTAVGDTAGGRMGPGPPTQSGTNLGGVAIELASSSVRSLTSKDITRRWRELTPPIPDVEELTFVYDYLSAGDPINIELQAADVDMLQRAAEQLKSRLAEYAGVFDIADSFTLGKEEVKLTILPSAEALGLTLQDLARQVRQAFYGEEAQRIQRDRDDVRVMVRYPESERRSLSDLQNLRIRTPQGGEVPFYVVARADLGRGYSTIRRADRERIISVTADVDTTQANANEIIRELQRDFLPALVAEHRGLAYELEGSQREQRKTSAGLVRDFALALMAIFALLAVPLRSYAQPLIIMAVIPFGLVGAIGGHMLMGLDLSMMSVFGVIALSGVVVNSSLVLVHYINQQRASGNTLAIAVRDAGVARFRPIVLTTLTTFAGLTPLLLERSMGAKFLQPMATSLGFGVVFATVISLFLVPCGYMVLEDFKGLLRRDRGAPQEHRPPRKLRGVEPEDDVAIAAGGRSH